MSNVKTNQLLRGGVYAGLLFYGLALVQGLLRDGFDITKHPVSMLSLGGWGWVQIVSFLITGLLLIGTAVGIRKKIKGQKAGTWGPILVGIGGLGFMLAGIFTADPAMGFPVGVAEPATESTHSMLHMMSFMLAFNSLMIATFVFARRFLTGKLVGLGVYSLATGIAIPVIISVSMSMESIGSLLAAATGILSFIWLAMVSKHLIALKK